VRRAKSGSGRAGARLRRTPWHEYIEEGLNLLEKAERPLGNVGKSMAWSRAENEVRAFIERTRILFLRSRMGKGVMLDDYPLSVAAAHTLGSQNADVVFLMGARFNWIFVSASRHALARRPRLSGDRAIEQGVCAPPVVPPERHAPAPAA
jgi:thiamine pyrophosphate-dependent acetolactate synthase large subunit-like protein